MWVHHNTASGSKVLPGLQASLHSLLCLKIIGMVIDWLFFLSFYVERINFASWKSNVYIKCKDLVLLYRSVWLSLFQSPFWIRLCYQSVIFFLQKITVCAFIVTTMMMNKVCSNISVFLFPWALILSHLPCLEKFTRGRQKAKSHWGYSVHPAQGICFTKHTLCWG